MPAEVYPLFKFGPGYGNVIFFLLFRMGHDGSLESGFLARVLVDELGDAGTAREGIAGRVEA